MNQSNESGSEKTSEHKRSLTTKILISLVAGAAVGVACNLAWGKNNALESIITYGTEPAGRMWLRMLIMIVVPLVFASLALGVARLGNLKKLGRMGVKTFLYFNLVTALSVCIGLAAVNWIRPGEGLPEYIVEGLTERYQGDVEQRMELAEKNVLGINKLVNIVPYNPVRAAADNDMLALIFFSLVFGIAMGVLPPAKSESMMSFLQGLNDTVAAIIDLVMKLAPFGVFCLIFSVTARFGFDLLGKLGWFVITVLGALAFQQFVVYSILVKVFARLSPIVFFKAIKTVMITGFSTSSSSATLPTSIRESEKQLGVPKEVAGFVLPLGATMNMDGTALFEGVTVLFIAQVFDVNLSLGAQFLVLLLAVITSIGVAGVPGGAIPMMALVLGAVGVPGEGIAIVMGVDRLLDMSRTTVNVSGDISAAAFISRSEGYWK